MKQLIPPEVIEQKIFFLRGQRVMLSPHLAMLYGVETRALNQAVKRNISRFPNDFVFQLNDREANWLVSHSVIPHRKHLGGTLPYAFTEQGVAMLSSVLNSPRAIQMNIAIVRAFVKLREVLSTHKELALKLKQLKMKVARHDEDIKVIFEAIRRLMAPPPEPLPKRRIGFGVEEPRVPYSAWRTK